MSPENRMSVELPQVLASINSQLDQLSDQVPHLESQSHHQNLFYTKCAVMTKVCSVIIDGDACTNVASTYMVEKLGLITTPHPHPYQLRCLDGKEETKVEEQVQFPFKIGGYVDTITCDVFPMQSSHILLGRPWQFDREAVHDSQTNRYVVKHEGRRFKLIPMTPEQIRETHKVSRTKQAAHFCVTPKVVVRKIEKPRELPHEVVEQQIVGCKDEVSTRIDKVQHQDDLGGALIFSRVIYVEDVNVHPKLVVPSVEIMTFMELLCQRFKGRNKALVVISAQTANPWTHEGSKYLGVPFDPGRLQSSFQFNFVGN